MIAKETVIGILDEIMKARTRWMEQIGFFSEQNKKHPPLVRDAVSLIEAEYAYLYGVDELADRLEVTKHHLIRLFSAALGISPGKYLADVRMYHAKKILQSTRDTPLEIIAGACGYSCANYFSKVFKKHTGLTPTEYAQSAQARGNSEASEVYEPVKEFYL